MGGQFGVNEGRLTADLGGLQWCGRPEISPERRWCTRHTKGEMAPNPSCYAMTG
jgi:hypothetical protein